MPSLVKGSHGSLTTEEGVAVVNGRVAVVNGRLTTEGGVANAAVEPTASSVSAPGDASLPN